MYGPWDIKGREGELLLMEYAGKPGTRLEGIADRLSEDEILKTGMRLREVRGPYRREQDQKKLEILSAERGSPPPRQFRIGVRRSFS